MDITSMTLCALLFALENNELSAEDVVGAHIERVRQTSSLNNFITLRDRDELVREARDIDVRRAKGEIFPLAGIPVAVKDNIKTNGIATTCASNSMRGVIPSEDADIISTLKAAGAVVIGKTNMDEFAMGSTNEYSAFGGVNNALDVTRVPGGSSGGSANAVAAKQAPIALGTDTGGSVRQPAAYCGVVGVKPTYTERGRQGIISMSPSLEQIGFFTRDCDDAAALSSILRSNGTEFSIHDNILRGDVKGKKLFVAKEFTSASMSDEVLEGFASALEKLEKSGAEIVYGSIPSFKKSLAAYHVISSAEAAATMREYIANGLDATKLGDEVVRRMVIGRYVVSGDNYEKLYISAARTRAAVKAEYEHALKFCDAMICPTCPTTATKHGDTDPIKTHGLDAFVAPVSLAGLPAVSVPFGNGEGKKLPVGIQIIGKPFAEREILNIGKALTA